MISTKKFRYLVPAAAGYAVLALIINLADTNPSKTRAASSNISSVQVVNSPGSPVPTAAQGTTAISGTVGISGTPSVSISGSPTFGINPLQNTVQLLKDPENPARSAFTVGSSCAFSGSASCTDGGGLTFPSGKESVIQFITILVHTDSGMKGAFVLLTDLSTGANLTIPMTLAYDDGTTTYFVNSQQIMFYVDPSHAIQLQCNLSATSAHGGCQDTMTGYYVNLP